MQNLISRSKNYLNRSVQSRLLPQSFTAPHQSQRQIFSLFQRKKEPQPEPTQPTEEKLVDPKDDQESYKFVKHSETPESTKSTMEQSPSSDKQDQQLDHFKQIQEVKEEETQILRDLYEVKEEEGLEKFETSLTKIFEYENRLAQSKDLRALSTLISDTNKQLQMKFKREHKYTIEKYEEQLYKEVLYDLRPGLIGDDDFKITNPLKKAKYPSKIRNIEETSMEALNMASQPLHMKKPSKVKDMHYPDGQGVIDNYAWVRDMSEEDKILFKRDEEEYTQLSLLKNDLLHKILLREQEFYEQVPQVLPARMGDYIYYRKFDNPADSLTLYRFPIDKLAQWGFKEGEVPFQQEEVADRFPEQIVFSISDLKLLYQDFALSDERIKDFVEKLVEDVSTQSSQPFHWFHLDQDSQSAVLVFDMEQNNQSYDIVVKDLSIDRLMPILILNTDGEVAYDKFNGFFYTQVDASGRGCKVFRHQLGTIHQEDILFYEETNSDFAVSVEQTMSGEYVMIKIRSTFKPQTNEIWIKNSHDDKGHFWLVQPMQAEVKYDIKHSGEFLYKISNEDDKINFKVSKIRLPDKIRYLPEGTDVQALPYQQDKQLLRPESSSLEISRLGKREIAPYTRFLNKRADALLVMEDQDSALAMIEVPPEQTTLIQASYEEKILSFEVFKHYLALLQEKNYQRELKIINLKTGREHLHLFDSSQELDPASGATTDFFNVELEDNYTFDASSLRYRLSTPNTPERVYSLSMGTKKADQIFFEQYKNFSKPENIHCEKINVKMRDDFEIPMVMTYDKNTYNDQSPWILFTKGVHSNKADLSFDSTKISLMNRGIVCAYPLIRGTRYFDDNWFFSGVGERKLTHVMDFIDSAIYIKEKGLADKIGVLGLHDSGSLTALTSIFQEPILFNAAAVYNPITDLISHLLYDIENRSTKQSPQDYEDQHYSKLQELGDIQNKVFYESLHLISPYHMPSYKTLLTDLLVTVDQDYIYGYHSRKLMCKLREVFMRDPQYIFYKEYPKKMFTENEKLAHQYAFLINSLLFR